MDRPGFRKPEIESDDSVASAAARDWGDDWVHELIAMTRPGVDMELPDRGYINGIVFYDPDDLG
jgi:hypothetical protein